MQLSLKAAWLKQLVEEKRLRQDFLQVISWRSDESFVEVSAAKFADSEIKALRAYLTGLTGQKTRGLIQKLNAWTRLKADPDGVVISRLEQLAAAVKAYVAPSVHKWLFRESDDGVALPYYVASTEYRPASRDGGPAAATVNMAYGRRNSTDTMRLTFYSDDLHSKKTVVQLLNERGYYLETPGMIEDYRSSLAVYKAIQGGTGKQYLAYGMGRVSERFNRPWISMERDGHPSKVVMDDLSEEAEGSDSKRRNTVVSSAFWHQDDAPAQDEEDEGVIEVPLHPYVNVFSLQTHQFASIHVSFLEEYSYDEKVVHKLILPDDRKQLIGMLVAGSSQLMEDIVKGKTGGIIVIAVGPPGTGKTLTAQVFSEQIKQPLYEVQCSQLGTNERDLEEALNEVLARAMRWNAILLIDEADVYIHERGEDIHQNAVVGVFLRVLENYRGVLFMTSNRSTIIDDAILSRATAFIQYTYPCLDDLRRIWRVLADNYFVEFTDAEIDALAIHFQGISGRRVKALLKLARLAACHRNERVTLDLVRYVDQFLPEDATATAAKKEC